MKSRAHSVYCGDDPQMKSRAHSGVNYFVFNLTDKTHLIQITQGRKFPWLPWQGLAMENKLVNLPKWSQNTCTPGYASPTKLATRQHPRSQYIHMNVGMCGGDMPYMCTCVCAIHSFEHCSESIFGFNPLLWTGHYSGSHVTNPYCGLNGEIA